MRLDTDRRNISIAGFLLCLLGIYAISPVDYFFRTKIGSRSRTVRTCRLDDQDHQDHALDAPSLISDSLSNHGGDGGDYENASGLAVAIPRFAINAEAVPEFPPASIRPIFLPASSGRPPPSAS
jgi:hypothetical protein